MKCMICGEESGGRRQICSEECRAKRRRRLYIENAKTSLFIRECAVCGKEFTTNNPLKDTCNKKCAMKYANRNAKPKRIKQIEQPKLSIAEVNAEARKQGLTYGQYVLRRGL